MSLILTDGKATPVDHTFTQIATQSRDQPAELVNRSNTNGPSFWERVTSLVTISRKATTPHVNKIVLDRPISGVDINGNPIVKGRHKLIITALIDPTVSSESDIHDTFAMGGDLLNEAAIQTSAKQLAPLSV